MFFKVLCVSGGCVNGPPGLCRKSCSPHTHPHPTHHMGAACHCPGHMQPELPGLMHPETVRRRGEKKAVGTRIKYV